MKYKIYVKRTRPSESHPKGYFYLGKTEQKEERFVYYLGSGKIWKTHIKKYGYTKEDIETWILHETNDKEDLKNMGIYYSDLFNIVDSDLWANLKKEEGDGGVTSEGHWVGEKNPFYKKGYKQLGEKNPMYKKGYLISGEKHPLFGKNNPQWGEVGKRKRKKIDQFDLQGNFIRSWDGMREAARNLKLIHSAISASCRNKINSVGGFIFKYKQ
jgi:hypothetical protein